MMGFIYVGEVGGGTIPEEYMITVSDLTQYYYCPRKVYFLKTMKVPLMPKRKMTLGKEEENKERKRVTERKDVFGIESEQIEEVLFKLYIEDKNIGLCGLTDTVLKLKGGKIIPVDIKYSDFVATQRHWKKQLTAYAMLLSKKFETNVDCGILYFPAQNEQIFVEITEDDKKYLLLDIEKVRELIVSERIPRKADESKCRYCEVKKYCV